MQTSRKRRVIVEPLVAIARHQTADYGPGHAGAKVTVLGDYVGRHGKKASDQSLPRRRTNDCDVSVIDLERGVRHVSPRQNHLLAALPADDYLQLAPQLEPVSLPCGRALCEPYCTPDHVYFPIDGIVSTLCDLENGNSVEVAITGNEGLVGASVFLGGEITISREIVRHAGHGFRIPADGLKSQFECCPRLRQSLLRYAQALLVQMTQTGACYRQHRLEQQLARLLLATLDRLPGNEVALTQDALGGLLGARRESITATAGKFQEAGLIRYFRGRITVLSRPQLEARACECYAVVKTALHRLLPAQCPSAHSSGSIARSARQALAMEP